MPVGGSRHYDGGGLGAEAGWKCPSCGTENQGPLAQGCALCGAGKPGRHIGREAPPPAMPPTPPPEPDPPPTVRQGDVATYWAETHPDVSVEYAYRAGYYEGVRAAREAQRPAAAPTADGERQEKIARTIIAALSYFADHVLPQAPHEVASGEWCSVDEVRSLIQSLTTTGEVAHA
jgi:hypothetical protein